MERLHKFMAHCGIASRRQAEDYIKKQRVTVNGETVTELGVKINPESDVVTVDGKVLRPEKKVCYLLHKPRGYATTVDDDMGRRTVIDLLPDVQERIYPAGRLDLDSEGLIVLTNDGDAAYFLTHPSCGVRKVYEALVEGAVEDDTIATLLEKGVYLGAMRIKPVMAKIVRRQEDSTVVRVIVAEGVNREVRRLFAALGHEVKRLVRLEVGPFRIDGIARGKYRPATPQEMAALHAAMEALPARESTGGKKARRKAGPPAPRPGKPDPALYGKGDKPRRAPLVLNHKPRVEDVPSEADDYADESYFDAPAPAPRGRGFRRDSNVSYETRPGRRQGNAERLERRARPGKDFSRRGNRDWDNGDEDFAASFHRSRPGKNPGRRPFVGKGRGDGEAAEMSGYRGERRHGNRGGNFGDGSFSPDFRRPPARSRREDNPAYEDRPERRDFSRGERPGRKFAQDGNRSQLRHAGPQGNPARGGHGRPAYDRPARGEFSRGGRPEGGRGGWRKENGHGYGDRETRGNGNFRSGPGKPAKGKSFNRPSGERAGANRPARNHSDKPTGFRGAKHPLNKDR